MSDAAYRCVWMLVLACMILIGVQGNARYAQYTRVETQHVTLVDAFDKYDGNGNPTYIGMFEDKKTGGRFEHALQPKTYREFVNSNSTPRDMLVRKSRDAMNDPKSPSAAIVLSEMLLVFGSVFFIYQFICLLFFRRH